MKMGARRVSSVLLLISFLIMAAAQGSDETMSVVPASDIIAQIEKDMPLVVYDHVIVEGDLDLKRQYQKTQSGEPSVNSSISILDSAIEGNVNLDGITFLHRVTFLNTTFNKSVSFKNSKFKDSAAFNNSKFNGTADFRYSMFEEAASFPGSEFDGPAIFKNAVFTKSANFTEDNFANGADFQGSILQNYNFRNSKFNHYASFTHSSFLSDLSNYDGGTGFGDAVFNSTADFMGSSFGDISFQGSHFNEETIFEKCNFTGIPTSFHETKFHGNVSFAETKFQDVIFRYSKFDGEANFRTTLFCSGADFSDSTFKKCAYFTKAIFGNSSKFKGVTFNKSPSFGEANFQGDVSFENCTFLDDRFLMENSNRLNRTCCFLNKCLNPFGLSWQSPSKSAYFAKAVFAGEANFQRSNISHKIDFSGAKFERLLIRWDNVYPPHDLGDYPQFRKNYKNLSWFDDASDCFYDYRVHIRNSEPLGFFTRTVDFAAERSYGYGVKPLYPLMLSLLFILIFGLIFWLYDGKSVNSIFGYIYFSLNVFISGVKFLGFESVERPNKKQAAIAYDIEKWLGLIFGGLIFLAISKSVLDVVSL